MTRELAICALVRSPSPSLKVYITQSMAETPAQSVIGEGDAAALAYNLESVRARIAAAAAAAGRPSPPSLVAVSKTKPVELLRIAYDRGQRDFGENYVQEVVAKAPQMPADVRWHFIGHLQSNKAKDLVAAAPNLFCVHTVDSLKLAQELQKRVAALRPDNPLAIMVQVNTSAEASKSGVAPADCAALAAEVARSCPLLRVCGLMCIGKYSADEGSALSDFEALVQCRVLTAEALGVGAASLELSMGMSHDFEQAVAAGATAVRVGSTIFGRRG